MRTIDLRTASARDAYRLLADLVVPRPIAFVSTVSPDGVANLAPFSFFIVGGANPPSVAFSPVLDRRGAEKDTLRNIRATGEFVINLVTREMAEGMNAASANLAPDVSEWDRTDFVALPSQLVRPPRVAESPVQLECRLHTIVEHGGGPSAARYVIGEVVLAHVSAAAEPGAWAPIARSSGSGYVDLATAPRFDMNRPD